MKILVYADLHGNSLALEELEKTEDYKTADLRIFLGDAVGKCAFSNECLNKVFESGDVFLMGNHDYFCAFGLPKNKEWTERKIEYVNFLRERVSQENIEKLQNVKNDFWLEKFGKKLYFTHYIWECEGYAASDPDEPGAPTEKTGKLFENVDADYIFFGHNHQAADFEAYGKKFCCVGSLGINKPCNRGVYVVVDLTENEVKIERKSVFFDAKKMHDAILAEGSPRAQKYAKWFET